MRWKLFYLSVVFLFICIPYSHAISEDGICISAEVTSIEPSSIDADQDFTVGIEISNCGNKIPENITFEIDLVSSDISIKEPLIQTIGQLGYSNSKRFLIYHMHSSPDAIPGEHIFKTKLTYILNSFVLEKNGNFSVTINSQKPDLTISRTLTNPEEIHAGETFALTIDVENAGKGDAKDVQVNLKNNSFSGVELTYLGQIKSGENAPARFFLTAKNSGIYSLQAEIQYKANGQIQTINLPVGIEIKDKSTTNYIIIIGVIIVILIAYFSFKNKNPVSR